MLTGRVDVYDLAVVQSQLVETGERGWLDALDLDAVLGGGGHGLRQPRMQRGIDRGVLRDGNRQQPGQRQNQREQNGLHAFFSSFSLMRAARPARLRR